MRVKFSEKFNWTPPKDRRVTFSYRPDGGAAGDGEYTVTRECGERAVGLGRAVEIDTPAREEGGGEPGLSEAAVTSAQPKVRRRARRG